jgi:methylmalonyl-CoA/ethylmalonyl-CoA epimerase
VGFKEFIDAGREGMHHLRFVVDNIEEKVKEAETFGYRQIGYKRFAEELAASYLEHDNDPLELGLLEKKLG